MEIKYNFSVPNDWNFDAKDFFLMGENAGGSSGVGEDIVGVVDIVGAEIPDGAARAWKTVVASALSSVSLLNTSWEDVNVRIRLTPKHRVTFEMVLALPSGDYQTLYKFTVKSKSFLTQDRFMRINTWKPVERTNVTKENIPVQVTVEDSCQSGILLIASDYYSPTYRRNYSELDVAAFVATDPEGTTVVKRSLFCNPTEENATGQWEMYMEVPELCEEYVIHHTPLDMEEDEARIFFGHVAQEDLVTIIRNLWKRIKKWFSGKSELNRYGV